MGRPRRIGVGLVILTLVFGVGLGALDRAGLLPEPVRRALSELTPEEGEVTRVTDGDTLAVHDTGTVRIIGIDTMDSVNEERVESQSAYYEMTESDVRKWSARATAFVREKAEDRVVSLQFGPERRDRYGRALAYVHLPDGTDLGLLLIRRGLAAAYRKFEHPRREVYIAAEAVARTQGVGLWKDARRRDW